MKKYYFIHFSFLILGSVIFFLVSKRVEHLYFFLFGFCWNFTFLTPGMIEKIKSRRYRFSLLRLTYVIHDGVGKLLKFLANRELVLIQDLVAPLAFYLPFALVFDSDRKSVV